MLEVLNGGPFPQKLGVRHHRALGVGPCFPDDALHLVAGANRYGRFRDHHRETVERSRNLAGGIVNETEIRKAVAAARWCSYRNEYGVGIGNRAIKFRRKS